MAELIITDLDYTLVNTNLERDFIIFNIIRPYSTNIIPIFALFYHLVIKKIFNLIGIKYNFKLFYFPYNKSTFNFSLKRWLTNIKKNEIFINKNIINKFQNSKLNIVLTSCPYVIAKPFVKHILEIKKTYVIGTKFETFLGKIIYSKNKMQGNAKTDFVKSKILKYKLVTKGYGDSPSDKGFLELCDDYEEVAL